MPWVSKVTIMLIIVLIAAITMSIITYVPTTTSFSPYNTYGDGLSVFVNDIGVKPNIVNTDDIGCKVLIVVAEKPLDEDKINIYENFVAKGGTLIVFDDAGYTNNLFSKLGLGITIVNKTVLDEVFKEDDRFHVKARYSIDSYHGYVILYKPGFIEISDLTNKRVILYSSSYSYVDMDGNGYYTVGEPIGQKYLGVEAASGKGRIIVIADKDIVTNSIIVLENNTLFTKELIGQEDTCLDLSELKLGPMDYLKFHVNKYTTFLGSDYLLAGFLIAVTGVGVYARRRHA
ncbi:hypothetical protein J4526_05680 [Desulfurococcaceae archaeon MEX13E-LK6-19]|nr:hypothetical protein J4526_05680 [Desulfurococcaceae archaeon MEX13E-LK6-19]